MVKRRAKPHLDESEQSAAANIEKFTKRFRTNRQLKRVRVTTFPFSPSHRSLEAKMSNQETSDQNMPDAEATVDDADLPRELQRLRLVCLNLQIPTPPKDRKTNRPRGYFRPCYVSDIVIFGETQLAGSTDTAASFAFEKEDHTLGNALRYLITKKYVRIFSPQPGRQYCDEDEGSGGIPSVVVASVRTWTLLRVCEELDCSLITFSRRKTIVVKMSNALTRLCVPVPTWNSAATPSLTRPSK